MTHELLAAFSSAEPITHELFKNAKETKETGFQRLFTCYNLGVSRLKAILRQDIYKIEKQNLVGRHIRDIVRYKSEDFQTPMLNNHRKATDKDMLESHPTKCQRQQTTESEKKILEAMLDDTDFSEDKAFKILHQLCDLGEE